MIKQIRCFKQERLARGMTDPALIVATGSLNGFTQRHVTAQGFFLRC